MGRLSQRVCVTKVCLISQLPSLSGQSTNELTYPPYLKDPLYLCMQPIDEPSHLNSTRGTEYYHNTNTFPLYQFYI